MRRPGRLKNTQFLNSALRTRRFPTENENSSTRNVRKSTFLLIFAFRLRERRANVTQKGINDDYDVVPFLVLDDENLDHYYVSSFVCRCFPNVSSAFLVCWQSEIKFSKTEVLGKMLSYFYSFFTKKKINNMRDTVSRIKLIFCSQRSWTKAFKK